MDSTPQTSVDSTFNHPFVRALDAPVTRPRTSPLYALWLLVVTAVMITLPLIYLTMIAAVAYATYYHLANHGGILSGARGPRSGIALLFVYLAPAVIGGALVLFMVKPLFASSRQRLKPVVLDRRAQPLMYAFVDRLCDNLGAPRPAHIEVDVDLNASAKLQHPWNPLRSQVVLTIGLPLLTTMPLAHFTSVLAHEFGHFTQRLAVRCYMLMMRVNTWFARVVYERDSWDDALANAGDDDPHILISIIVLLLQGCVWLTRRILAVLMFIGHLVSAALSRQMEFDADRFSAAVVGPKVVADSLESLAELAAAQSLAIEHAQSTWREKRLPADLPALVALQRSRMSPEVLHNVRLFASAEKTEWFATHPATPARVARVRRLAAAAPFAVDAPAARLLADLPSLSANLTRMYYLDVLGPVALNADYDDATSVEQQTQESAARLDAANRYFKGLLHPLLMVPLPTANPRLTYDQAAERVMELRQEYREASEAAPPLLQKWEQLRTAVVEHEAQLAMSLSGARTAIDDAHARRLIAQTAPQYDDAAARLRRILTIGNARLAHALLLSPEANQGPVDEYDLAPPPSQRQAILAALAIVTRQRETVAEVLRLHTHLRSLANNYTDNQTEHFAQSILAATRKLQMQVMTLSGELKDVPFPFDPAGRQTVAAHILPTPPTDGDPAGVLIATQDAISALFDLYVRMMAHLCEIAEQAESQLGLDPL